MQTAKKSIDSFIRSRPNTHTYTLSTLFPCGEESVGDGIREWKNLAPDTRDVWPLGSVSFAITFYERVIIGLGSLGSDL